MRITINGIIAPFEYDGYVSEKSIKNQLANLKDNEEIEIVITSPGGSCYEGYAIFNLIRDVAKKHTCSVIINGLCASMATYIALAARTIDTKSTIKVSDNSIFMIHNPYSANEGDYREMEKESVRLEKLTTISAQVYSAVSGIVISACREMMDDETWLVGKEISDKGFANIYEPIATEKKESMQMSRDAQIITSQTACKSARNILAEQMQKQNVTENLDKAVALLGTFLPNMVNTTAQAAENQSGVVENNGGIPMDPKQLQSTDKGCYDAIFALGEQAGISKERERVCAHIKLGEQSGSLETSAKFIKDGSQIGSDTVQADYLSMAMAKQQNKNRIEDNPADTGNTPAMQKTTDAAELAAAFDAGAQGKEIGGAK